MDTGLFPAGKAAGRHADPTPASSAYIKNEVYFLSPDMSSSVDGNTFTSTLALHLH